MKKILKTGKSISNRPSFGFKRWIYIILFCIIGTGCQTNASTEISPTGTYKEIISQNTPLKSSFPHTATATGYNTLSPTPSFTPSSPYPVLQGTPIPQPFKAIIPDNALDAIQIARWGMGTQYQVAWSPDGSLLAIATSTGIYFYDPNSMDQIRKIETPDIVRSIVFLPDGILLAGGLNDGSIRLWRVDDGLQVRTLEGHSDSVNSVVCSPDGSLLASGSSDKTLRIWKVADGSLLYHLEGHTDSVNSIAFSPDGMILASGSMDKTIGLWRLSEGSSHLTVIRHSESVLSVAFSPDGTQLAGGTIGGAKLWEVASGNLINQLYGGNSQFTIYSVSFSPDGTFLAGGGSSGQIRIWRMSDKGIPSTDLRTDYHNDRMTSVAFSSDGTRLAVESRSRTKILRTSDGAWLNSPVGDWSEINQIAISSNRSQLVTGSKDGTIRLRQIPNGNQIDSFGISYPVNCVAFSPDGTELAVGSSGDVWLWPLTQGKDPQYLAAEGPGYFTSVAFSPDWQLFAYARWLFQEDQYFISIRNIFEYGYDQYFRAPSFRINSLVFSPNGKLLASGSTDGVIRLWRVADGIQLGSLKGHTSDVNNLAFSPDGKLIASGSSDKTIRLWRAADGELLFTLEGHSGGVNSIAFSPDGTILASGSVDGTIRLWFVSDGTPLRTLEGHVDSVNSVTFSMDGLLLASGSDDGTVRLWGIIS